VKFDLGASTLDFSQPGFIIMGASEVFRFARYELDVTSGELRRDGLKVRLPEQSFQILCMLLARPGELVTREELRHKLWSDDTFVDFNVGLNSAVRKLREALEDSASRPTFIETLPRRGYRFIGIVTERPHAVEPIGHEGQPPPPIEGRAWFVSAAAAAITMVILGVVFEHELSPRARINPEAYDAYRKGLAAEGRAGFDGFRTAVTYYETAVAVQPNFAEGYAALARAQSQLLFGGPLSPREIIPKAEAAARKALQLDATLTDPHRTLGTVLANYYWQTNEALEEFRLAGQPRRNPRAELARLLRARMLDPLSFSANMDVALAYRNCGQADRALEELRHALTIAPDQPRAHFQIGVTLVLMGRVNDAVSELEQAARSARGGNSRFEAYLGYAYAATGRTTDARNVLKALEARAEREYVSSFGIALIHDALGNKEAALEALERAYDDHAVEFAQRIQYPKFVTIASDPRYESIMRSVHVIREPLPELPHR
jgi:DNA-binding winged helix-turn-helix (wHTH) protein/Flp pilus assembly protein TadD